MDSLPGHGLQSHCLVTLRIPPNGIEPDCSATSVFIRRATANAYLKRSLSSPRTNPCLIFKGKGARFYFCWATASL
jgi:hypothetical protein